MQVTLNESEIKDALIQYVAGHGVAVAGRAVTVSLVAGRGPNGHSATIDISNVANIDLKEVDTNLIASVGQAIPAFPDNTTGPVDTENTDLKEPDTQVGEKKESLFGN